MNSESFISVIIPAYNSERFLARAIDSVLAQTFTNFEILVVDDGSTDATPEICRAYGGRIRYFRQNNGGEGAARNRGLREARGSLIAFLDSDDEYLPNALTDLVDCLARHPRAHLVCAAYLVSVDGKSIERKPAHQIATHGSHRSYLIEDFFATFARLPFVWVGTVLLRREVIECVGHFTEGRKRAVDKEMWFRCAGRFKWAYCDREVTIYNLRSDSISRTAPFGTALDLVWDIFREEKMQAFVDQPLWKSYRNFRRERVITVCMGHANRLSPKDIKDLLAVIPPADTSLKWLVMRAAALLPGRLSLIALLVLGFSARAGRRLLSNRPINWRQDCL